MSDTVLEHPLVREYLRELGIACAYLPLAQARELREQIAAHLDEALPPSATAEEVRAELSRLGSPRSLAADAAGPDGRPFARRLRNRLGRVRWWAWVALAALVALAASALTYTLLAFSVTLMQGPVSLWYYPQDQARSRPNPGGVTTQLIVPERPGQQGIEISVFNNSDWTQTVVGIDPNRAPFASSSVQVAVGSGKQADTGDSFVGPVSWSSPGSIPPHSFRLLRVVWRTGVCLGPRTEASINDLSLKVRVGIFTRTQEFPLHYTWTLAGGNPPACR
jgi:hypothetical protein